MIIITFSFLGKDVKVTTEGDHCIDKEYDENPQLKEIQKMNNSLLHKAGHIFITAYRWCNIHCTGKFKKGRDQSFYF